MKVYSVDRIEDGLAVLEDDAGVFFTVRIDDLPVDTKEGSVLRSTYTGFILDSAIENERRNKALSLQEMLRNKK